MFGYTNKTKKIELIIQVIFFFANHSSFTIFTANFNKYNKVLVVIIALNETYTEFLYNSTY